jgi:hypothetical protein
MAANVRLFSRTYALRLPQTTLMVLRKPLSIEVGVVLTGEIVTLPMSGITSKRFGPGCGGAPFSRTDVPVGMRVRAPVLCGSLIRWLVVCKSTDDPGQPGNVPVRRRDVGRSRSWQTHWR